MIWDAHYDVTVTFLELSFGANHHCYIISHVDGLVQDCSISSALAVERDAVVFICMLLLIRVLGWLKLRLINVNESNTNDHSSYWYSGCMQPIITVIMKLAFNSRMSNDTIPRSLGHRSHRAIIWFNIVNRNFWDKMSLKFVQKYNISNSRALQ